MSAGVARFETEVRKGLFPHLNRLANDLSFAIAVTAATFIQREFGIDEIAPVVRQPLRAVKCAIGLLATGQRNFDRAFGFIALLLEPD